MTPALSTDDKLLNYMVRYQDKHHFPADCARDVHIPGGGIYFDCVEAAPAIRKIRKAHREA